MAQEIRKHYGSPKRGRKDTAAGGMESDREKIVILVASCRERSRPNHLSYSLMYVIYWYFLGGVNFGLQGN